MIEKLQNVIIISSDKIFNSMLRGLWPHDEFLKNVELDTIAQFEKSIELLNN